MDSAGWDERYAASELVWSAGPNTWFEQVASALPPGSALDLAAGEGRNALWLAERGWTATAVDFSAVAVERSLLLAQLRLGAEAGRFSAVVADVLEYQPDVRAFDLVLVCYLHVQERDRRTVNRWAAEAVATGGLLVVVGHDSANILEGFGGPQDPALLFTAADIAADVEGCGLSVLRSEQVVRPVPSEPGDVRALDALFVAKRVEPGSVAST